MVREIIRSVLHFIKRIKAIMKPLYKLFVEINAAEINGRVYVNAYTRVNHNTYLGDNVNFNGTIIYGNGRVEIGNNFHSGQQIIMMTTNHNYDHGKAIPYDEVLIDKDIKIGDNVWICTKALILGGVTIGDGAIIQAGSTVVSDIPKYAVAGGNPAKVFKYRDREHYEKLVAEGKFM